MRRETTMTYVMIRMRTGGVATVADCSRCAPCSR
jgi:hypothetical protein